jgi:MATE family multidrug resistance protein
MAAGIMLYIYLKPDYRKYRTAFRPGQYSKKLFRQMMKIGIPSGAQFIFEAAAFDFSLVMMEWLGIVTQAAHQIVINLASLTYMITAGLGAAATVRVGFFSGNRDPANISRAAYSLLVMGITSSAKKRTRLGTLYAETR